MHRDEIKTILKVAFTYIATIIGAGFASGQEIIRFFTMYDGDGFFGILLASVLFSVIGGIVLEKVFRERIRDYNELIFPMLGWFFGWVTQIIVTIFFLVLFCVMLAGCSSILHEKLGIPLYVSISAAAFVSLLIILKDSKGIVAVSSIVSPVVIVGIIIVCLYAIISKDAYVFSFSVLLREMTHNWVASAIIYVSYNSLLSMVVLSGLQPIIKSRREAIIGGAAGGVIFFCIALILNMVILIFSLPIATAEIPVLGIIEKYCVGISGIYTFILCLSMFLSAVISGNCLVDRVSSVIKADRRFFAFIFCLIAIPFASIGFSKIIAVFYPAFGYLGLFLVAAVILDALRAKRV